MSLIISFSVFSSSFSANRPLVFELEGLPTMYVLAAAPPFDQNGPKGVHVDTILKSQPG
jgi:hypothetical protein